MRRPSKLGREELEELIDLWRISPEGRRKIRAILAREKDPRGPHLFRYYGPGPSKVAQAEKLFAKFIGVPHALAVNSCTSALVAAFRALGIGMGDEVIVPAYTFFATAATVAVCNAIPVIADVDDTLTLDPKDVERRITDRTRAIAVVHMRGAPAQMDEIMRIARRRKLAVVEDVAQSCGGSYRGRKLGAIGDVGCFSFDFYKMLNCGEGGFLTTRDEWLYTRAQSWHDTAACWRPDRYAAERREGELFCGENYRMSELQGAVALAQIRKADRFLKGYRASRDRILRALHLPEGVALRRLADPEGDTGVCIIFYLPDVERTKRALKALKAEGVPAGGVYDARIKDWHIYAHWEHILDLKSVAHDGLPWSGVPQGELPRYSTTMCPNALDYLSRAIMVDVKRSYTAGDCKAIAAGVNKVLRAL
ncbi:MAG: DegT/DnrJ/EryC1/StrS family aminotransferase [Candidatus Brocadiia bacterium]